MKLQITEAETRPVRVLRRARLDGDVHIVEIRRRRTPELHVRPCPFDDGRRHLVRLQTDSRRKGLLPALHIHRDLGFDGLVGRIGENDVSAELPLWDHLRRHERMVDIDRIANLKMHRERDAAVHPRRPRLDRDVVAPLAKRHVVCDAHFDEVLAFPDEIADVDVPVKPRQDLVRNVLAVDVELSMVADLLKDEPHLPLRLRRSQADALAEEIEGLRPRPSRNDIRHLDGLAPSELVGIKFEHPELVDNIPCTGVDRDRTLKHRKLPVSTEVLRRPRLDQMMQHRFRKPHGTVEVEVRVREHSECRRTSHTHRPNQKYHLSLHCAYRISQPALTAPSASGRGSDADARLGRYRRSRPCDFSADSRKWSSSASWHFS